MNCLNIASKRLAKSLSGVQVQMKSQLFDPRPDVSYWISLRNENWL